MTSATQSTRKTSTHSLTTVKHKELVSTSTMTFDVETNALKPREVTKIHCCAISQHGETKLYKDPQEWLPLLEEADVIAGHNVIQYDIPAIQNLYPDFKPKGLVLDTLILCRMVYPNLLDLDFKKKWPGMPMQMYGRHSLEAYGFRLGHSKRHADMTDFSELTEELAERCVCDVELNVKLLERLKPQIESMKAQLDQYKFKRDGKIRAANTKVAQVQAMNLSVRAFNQLEYGEQNELLKAFFHRIVPPYKGQPAIIDTIF